VKVALTCARSDWTSWHHDWTPRLGLVKQDRCDVTGCAASRRTADAADPPSHKEAKTPICSVSLLFVEDQRAQGRNAGIRGRFAGFSRSTPRPIVRTPSKRVPKEECGTASRSLDRRVLACAYLMQQLKPFLAGKSLTRSSYDLLSVRWNVVDSLRRGVMPD
jgi:hypothetical protein